MLASARRVGDRKTVAFVQSTRLAKSDLNSWYNSEGSRVKKSSYVHVNLSEYRKYFLGDIKMLWQAELFVLLRNKVNEWSRRRPCRLLKSKQREGGIGRRRKSKTGLTSFPRSTTSSLRVADGPRPRLIETDFV